MTYIKGDPDELDSDSDDERQSKQGRFTPHPPEPEVLDITNDKWVEAFCQMFSFCYFFSMSTVIIVWLVN